MSTNHSRDDTTRFPFLFGTQYYRPTMAEAYRVAALNRLNRVR